ncbi:hypothetical protein N2152v2_008771 [Parachlorella kessleri]
MSRSCDQSLIRHWFQHGAAARVHLGTSKRWQAAEELDGSGKRFLHDKWTRNPDNPNAGYGITSVLEGGDVLEKGAVNISVLSGVLTPDRAKAMSSRGRLGIDSGGGQPYSAAAMSLVFHSAHPLIPTLRADIRLFEVDGQMWYGGGCDLTPFYVSEDDFGEFHSFWKQLCDKHDAQLYPEFQEWCDRYFYLPARKEHRGVGGIFFDDVDAAGASYNVDEFVREVGRGILPSWQPIVERRRGEPFTEDMRNWQLLRRGRYLEFNLLYDRGVKFGLDGGRIESIMVSAPPLIAWRYNVQPQPESPEGQLVQLLRQPRQWAS